MKKFAMIVKILIPLAFFAVAGLAYHKMPGVAAIGGTMTVIVLGFYGFESFLKDTK